MANVKGFTPLADPSWITLEFDDGSVSNPVQDPTGEYRQQVSDIASKIMGVPPPSAMAGAVAGPGGGAAPVTPPPVTPEAANAWSAAQARPAPAMAAVPAPQAAPVAPLAPAPVRPAAPPVAATVPATGAFPAAAPVPRGMARAGVARSVTGMAEDDKAQVDALNTEAIEAEREAGTESVKARLEQLNADWDRITDEEKGKLAEKQLLADKEAQFTQRFEAQMAANKDIAARPIDPAAAFDGDAGWYAFMAAFGDAVSNFGAALQGRGPVADPAGRINAIIDRSVRLQTAQKQAEFEAGKITADQLEAERERIRLNISAVGEQLAKTQAARAQTENERMGIGALEKKFAADVAAHAAANATATARQETRQEQFAPVVTGPAKVTNATKEALALLGVTPEQYTEGMNKKLGVGENAPTVNQSVTALKQMDQDLLLLEAIKAENGGTLPTRGVINLPAAFRGKLAQLGIESGMDAEEANQLITGYVIQKAKSYGGVITESDRENAELEFGKSGEGLVRGIKRMRNATNGNIKQTIDTIFPGVGQEVLNVSLRRAGQTEGVPEIKGVEDFEVQSAPHTDGNTGAQPSDIERRQEQNRARVVGRVGEVLKPIGESMARPPSGAYRGKM